MDKDKLKIKAAIVGRFGSQTLFARELGVTERRLSRLLNGHEQAKPEEVKKLRAKLGVKLPERR